MFAVVCDWRWLWPIRQWCRGQSVNLDGGSDHVHILFTTEPTTDLTKFINSLKGVTSRRIRQEYPEVKQTLEDAFWQPGYFLATTGQVSIDVLMEYVENQ